MSSVASEGVGERGRDRRRRGLVVVANRLPVVRVGEGSSARWTPALGGLVSALQPVLARRPGAWVGWTGDHSRVRPFVHAGLRIRPVRLTKSEADDFYHGMSNRTFWPLYHDAIRTPEFHRHWWAAYERVNERFAEAASSAAGPGDLVWVHDYHLQLVPAMLRRLRPDVRIGFFLHVPFPPEELFEWLPWRAEILKGLLGADVVGFQTHKAAQNFSRLCRDYTDAEGTDTELRFEDRTIATRSFPISIDFEWFDGVARSMEVQRATREIRRRVGEKRKILLAVDRLDYTKGVLRRLLAFEELLESGHADVDGCVLIQIAPPSRETVPEYADLRDEVERTVGRINGRFSEPGRVAVHYFRRAFTREQLAAYYAAADAMIVTPLRDGMNLVAKEYVACRHDHTGVLVLSQFAGAARELSTALIVNPRDQTAFVDALRTALRMPREAARMRMVILRNRVKRHDVHGWSSEFLSYLEG